MRTYMAFSATGGAHEGAILVIAKTARKAKVLAWQSGELLNVSEWVDVAVRWLRDDSFMKLSRNYPFENLVPHVTAEPQHCIACGLWGCGITAENRCCNCNEHPGDELIRLLTLHESDKANRAQNSEVESK